MTRLRHAAAEVAVLVPATMGAWVAAMLTGWAVVVIPGVLGGSPWADELAVLYVPVMLVPFGFGLAVVALPLVALASGVIEQRRTWLLPLVGMGAGLLEVPVLIAAGRVVLSGSPRLRPTYGADLAAVATQPSTVPILIALVAGGLVLGVWAARVNRASHRLAV